MQIVDGGLLLFIAYLSRTTALDLRPPSTAQETRWSAVNPRKTGTDGSGIPTRQPINVTTVAEQTVFLHCKTSSKDGDKLEWRRVNQLLPANHRQYVFPNGTLVIQKVDGRLDSGSYNCQVDRGNGAVSQQEYHLLVIIPPRVDAIAFPSDLAPGARAHISCAVSRGDPPMSIQWFKDGKPLTPNAAIVQDMLIQNIDEYTSFLAIPRLNIHHAGNYTCLASNKVAQNAKTARLVVNVPAYWVHEPTDAFALHKTDLSLTCQANGNPKPVMEWKKAVTGSLGNYTPVATSRSHLFENGTLLIESLERSDEGSYLCQATNGIGQAISKVIHVSVRAPVYFLEDRETVATQLGSSASLTCHAHGDPPISLTWFYKERELKENDHYDRLSLSSHNMSNSLKSTLVVASTARDDSGVYTCKVTNEFGLAKKQTTLLVQEPPEAPRGIRIEATNSRMVHVGWSASYDGNSPVINFIVEWKHPTDLWTDDGAKREYTPGNSSVYTVKNLKPASRYDIRVRASNLLGQSDPSQLVRILTDEEAPSEVPLDVKATAYNSTAIYLTWRPPAPHSHNGPLQGYNIGYKVENSSDGFVYKTVKSNVKKDESCTLSNLRKYTSYAIVIQAYNAMGSGPNQELANIWTMEDVPSEAPRSMTATPLTAQEISITWEQLPQESINGILLGFKLLFKPVANWTSQPEIKTVKGTHTVLDGLRKFTNYTIQILAFTAKGDGIVGAPIYVRSLPDVPSAPAEVKALITSPSSILVTWLEPIEMNGDIKLFNVYMRSLSNKKDKKRVVYPDGLVNKYEFTDLSPTEEGEFWVTAETDVGEGPASDRVKQAPRSFSQARIATFPMVISVPVGANAVLPCMAVGFPTPSLEWLRGERMIANNGKADVLNNGSLSLKKIHANDGGNYTCRVRNLHGTEFLHMALNVQQAPASPSVVISSPTFNSLRVDWRVPYDGGSTLKGFTLYYQPESGELKNIRLPANYHTFTLQNLLCGQTYHVYMTTYNEIGTSQNSFPVTSSTDGQAPMFPDLHSFLIPNSTSVLVMLSSWKSGGCPIKSFSMKYQAFESVEWNTLGNLIPGDAETVTLSELLPETVYRLSVVANNDAGSTGKNYTFGTLTEDGDAMVPEIVLQKERSVLRFHEDAGKIYPLTVGVILLVILGALLLLYVRRRQHHKYPSVDRNTNLRRDLTTEVLRRQEVERTPKKSASQASPWKISNEQYTEQNNHSPISLASTPKQWQPPQQIRNAMYSSPKRLNTAVRPRENQGLDGSGHYQTPMNRTLVRDESTPDSGFSGSNVKHTDCDSFPRESILRLSNGSTSDSDSHLHKLNLSFQKSRPKPAPRRRPPTRPRHLGTTSLQRPKVSSSSPSSAEELPYAYSTNRNRQNQPVLHFPSPPHSDGDEGLRPPMPKRQQPQNEAFNLPRFSHLANNYNVYNLDDMADEPLQPTTTV